LQKKLNFDYDLKNTLDVTFRKVQSEQVSPRTIIQHEPVVHGMIPFNLENKYFISKLSKQDWNDTRRFASIINKNM